MARFCILVPKAGTRRWQTEVARRLRAAGHEVFLKASGRDDAWPAAMRWLLAAETRMARRRERLSDPVEAAFDQAEGDGAAISIDLSGAGPADMTIAFDGQASSATAVEALIAGRLPEIALVGVEGALASARPMVDSRMALLRGLDDVLARAVSLTVATASRLAAGEPTGREPALDARLPAPRLIGAPQVPFVPRLAREMVRRLRHHQAHWRIGYRFHSGPGVAETGLLRGPDWSELPDDGLRYYADPFPFEHDGRHFLFAEEYPHATAKGIISMFEFDQSGRPSPSRIVLEEEFHLSYPQVFAHEGEIYMLPEGGAGGELVLYRAERFPDRWQRHRVMVPGRALYDATLLRHGGLHWLLAAERDGAGSSSDMLVAFHSPALEGPWTPHRANPILIDRAAARPGGAFARVGDRIVRPVQDGTAGYGGGLGLSDLLQLDTEAVRFSTPVPILGTRQWPHPRIHTLNRAGRLEVIDGIAEVRRNARAAA